MKISYEENTSNYSRKQRLRGQAPKSAASATQSRTSAERWVMHIVICISICIVTYSQNSLFVNWAAKIFFICFTISYEPNVRKWQMRHHWNRHGPGEIMTARKWISDKAFKSYKQLYKSIISHETYVALSWNFTGTSGTVMQWCIPNVVPICHTVQKILRYMTNFKMADRPIIQSWQNHNHTIRHEPSNPYTPRSQFSDKHFKSYQQK